MEPEASAIAGAFFVEQETAKCN